MATYGQFLQIGPYFSGGALQAGFKVYHYSAGTTTLKNVYTDRGKMTTAAQPVVADSQGIASFYADGIYKFVITDSSGATLYTYDNVNVADVGLTGQGNAIASSSTVTLGTDGTYFHVTGSVSITALSGTQSSVDLVFDSSPTLIYSGSLILMGQVNYTAAAGDVISFVNEGNGIWREISRSSVRTSVQDFPGLIENVGLSVTSSGNAIIVALKTKNLTDPTSASPCKIAFRDATITTGDYPIRYVTSALSVTVSSGSTLGFANSQTSRVYIGALDNSGTVELFVYHPLSGTSLKSIQDNTLYTTVAEGGAGAADNAQTLYSTALRTNVPVRLLGYFEIQTGGTAGVWSNAPTVVQLLGGQSPRTGTVIQNQLNRLTTVSTGTTLIPSDDTVPQISEGDEYLTQAITPSSSVNLLQIEAKTIMSSNNAGNTFKTLALFQDATANALAADGQISGQNQCIAGFINFVMVSGTTSSTTFRLRAGGGAAGTFTINGFSSARVLGGTLYTYLSITEIFV